jgi:hypothetical protein
MLKKATLSFLFFTFIAAASLWYYCFHVLPKDLKEYEKELKAKTAHVTNEKSKTPNFKQHRTGVRKDMWIITNQLTEHHQIEASCSTLMVKKIKGAWDMQEHLQDVVCCINPQNGQTKVIKTPEGFYDYKKKSFSSKKVDLFFFNPSSFSLKQLNSLTATHLKLQAYDVSFSLEAPELTFQATRLFGTAQKSFR